MVGVVMMEDHDSGARAAFGALRYRLTDLRSGEKYEVAADQVLRVVGVELCVIDWAIRVDDAFENGHWRIEALD